MAASSLPGGGVGGWGWIFLVLPLGGGSFHCRAVPLYLGPCPSMVTPFGRGSLPLRPELVGGGALAAGVPWNTGGLTLPKRPSGGGFDPALTPYISWVAISLFRLFGMQASPNFGGGGLSGTVHSADFWVLPGGIWGCRWAQLYFPFFSFVSGLLCPAPHCRALLWPPLQFWRQGLWRLGLAPFGGGLVWTLRNCLGLACPILVKLLCHILPRLDNPIGYPPPPLQWLPRSPIPATGNFSLPIRP